MTNYTQQHDLEKINAITGKILDAAIEVHRELGPGFLEEVYEECLAIEFDFRNINFIRQCTLPVYFKGIKTNKKYRVDFLVENEVPLELKAVKKLEDIHTAITINYIKMANRKVGVLINFNVKRLIDGYKRLIV